MKKILMILFVVGIFSHTSTAQINVAPGTCIKKANDPTLYMFLGAIYFVGKYKIPNMEMFNKIYSGPGAIKVLSDKEVDDIPTKEVLSDNTTLAMIDDAVVLISGDRLSWVENPDVMTKLGFNWNTARANKLSGKKPVFKVNDKVTLSGKTYTIWFSFK